LMKKVNFGSYRKFGTAGLICYHIAAEILANGYPEHKSNRVIFSPIVDKITEFLRREARECRINVTGLLGRNDRAVIPADLWEELEIDQIATASENNDEYAEAYAVPKDFLHASEQKQWRNLRFYKDEIIASIPRLREHIGLPPISVESSSVLDSGLPDAAENTYPQSIKGKAGAPPKQLNTATEALEALYPNGVPQDVTHVALTAEIAEWSSKHEKAPPSEDTVIRARKKYQRQ